MISRFANLNAQRGLSLIELMISIAISVLILSSIGSLFIIGQKLVAERSKRILVLQSMNDVMSLIKDDVHRAGFNDNSDSVLMLNHSVTSPQKLIQYTHNSIGYVYQNSNGEYIRRGFVFEEGNLKLCQATDRHFIAKPCLNEHRRYFLFDEKRLKIIEFNIQLQPRLNSANNHYLFRVSLTVALLDGSYQQTLSVDVMPRNWEQ
ncbi:MAG: PilW family protein [Vibrio sp.]